MIKAGIIGATGYAGGELVRLLTAHPDVEIVWYGSRSYIDKKYYEVYKNMFQIVDAVCLDDNMEELAKQADVIFTATPQGFCASLINEEILSNAKIVDLSADFRIKDVATYEKWYGIEHKAPQYIGEAVYGPVSYTHLFFPDIRQNRLSQLRLKTQRGIRKKRRRTSKKPAYLFKNRRQERNINQLQIILI